MKRYYFAIITGFIILLSFIFLSYKEQILLSENINKNWWAVYFQNPEDDSLSFTIENHSDINEFSFVVKSNSENIIEDKVAVKKGSLIIIPIGKNEASGNVKIIVNGNGEKKEISKNLTK